jgi:hypothetical protein
VTDEPSLEKVAFAPAHVGSEPFWHRYSSPLAVGTLASAHGCAVGMGILGGVAVLVLLVLLVALLRPPALLAWRTLTLARAWAWRLGP